MKIEQRERERGGREREQDDDWLYQYAKTLSYHVTQLCHGENYLSFFQLINWELIVDDIINGSVMFLSCYTFSKAKAI